MKRFFGTGWAIAVLTLLIVSGSVIVALSLSEKAFAAGEFYTLYYKKADINSIQLAINSIGNNSDAAGATDLYKTAVYARGGVFGDQVRFDYSNHIDSGFTYKYTHSCTYTPAAQGYGTGPSTIDITWVLNVPLGSNFDDKNSFKSAVHTVEIKQQGLQGTGIENLTYNQLTGDGKSKCFPGGVSPSSGPNVKTYRKLSSVEKNAWKNLETSEEAGVGLTGAAAAASGSSPTGETGTNCQGGALGWVLCPLIDYMTQALRVVAGLIDGLMQVRFLAQDGSSKAIETAWRAFLSVANILLVVAFMVIIFSQSTSLGLSNYGIKRMLPRLVIAAILMNVSFYICALAIDVSNIIGSSIMGFLVGSGNSIADSMTRATGGSTGLLGSVTNVGISAVLVFIAIMFLAPVVLSILLVFIMLIGRQVVLMVLVLVSPLAFVAWLLPNTEQYFKKWYGLFSELLILYPLVMLIFGASLYMANVIGGSDIFNGINLTPF